MLLIRIAEERIAELYPEQEMRCPVHLCIGQEAVAVGVCGALGPEDQVMGAHRSHGHYLARGGSLNAMMAELYGKATGCCGGKGGSMHLVDLAVNYLGSAPIVGSTIAIAVGAAFALQLRGEPGVTAVFFGEGATEEGVFHESMNFASLRKLPVLFVCENNQYATEVPFRYAAGNPSVAGRGSSYGIPGVEVDGNDVLAVHAAAEEAIHRARSGGGPTLLECRTYRTRAHAEGMGDFTYRTREEVEEWKARCPIARLRQQLLDGGLAAAAELDTIDAEINAVVAEAHQFAETSPWPDPATAATHVFDESVPARPAPPAAAKSDEREITFMQATLEVLSEEMAQNPRIFVLGEGIGKRGGNFRTTAGLYDLYGPERLCDTPICERGFVGLGCGAAMTGARPVIDFMFTDFILDAVGEIVNQIAKMQYMSSGRLKMPILLRGCIGIGHSAATHHSGNHYPMYAHFPGLRVVVPSTPYDARGLLKRALHCSDPVLFLEHRELLAIKGPVPQEPYEIEFGQAAVVREGKDVTVVALALMVHRALRACEQLAGEGISVELIDPRTVAPLDTDTIARSVRKTGRLLIVDEAFAPCGIGAEIAARIADLGFDDLDAPIRRLNGVHTPTPYSPPLEAAVVPQGEAIVQAIRDLVAE
jgi:2-oxoisovalerate dehydrogenase E1 component